MLGNELIKNIRLNKDFEKLKIVVMTSDETEEEKIKCKDLGVDLFFEKLLPKESLNDILKKFNYFFLKKNYKKNKLYFS